MAKKTPPARRFDKPMQVRVTPEQSAQYQRAADADGRSVSAWARDRLDKVAARELKRS